MKTHPYFYHSRIRHPEVSWEQAVWVAEHPEREYVQEDGRIRRWAFVPELERYVRVVLLEDGTLFNAFIDRNYRPEP